MFRPSIERRWTATPSSPMTRLALLRRLPRTPSARRRGLHGRCAGARNHVRRVHGDCDRRPTPSRRHCRRHGGRHVEGRRIRPSELGGSAGTEHRPSRCGRRDRPVGRFAGEVLTPSRVGAIAAVGAATVDVFDRPTVAVLSTGNEVVQPGATLRDGQVHDINQFTISAVVRRHGGVTRPLPPAGDTLEALHAALDAGLASDVIVFSGGSSVGGRDLMVDLGEGARPRRVSRHRREARQTHALRPSRPHARLRHAGLSDVVLVERVHAAAAARARDGPAAALDAADG